MLAKQKEAIDYYINKNSVEDALFIAGSNANVVNVYDPMKKYKEIDISDE